MVFKVLSLLWVCGVVEEFVFDGVELLDVFVEVVDLLLWLGDFIGVNGVWE